MHLRAPRVQAIVNVKEEDWSINNSDTHDSESREKTQKNISKGGQNNLNQRLRKTNSVLVMTQARSRTIFFAKQIIPVARRLLI